MMHKIEIHLRHMHDVLVDLQSAADDDLSHIRNKRFVERCLEILGEAARRIPREFQEEHAHIPWANIIGTRNIIAHDYERISSEKRKQILDHQVSALLPEIVKLIASQSLKEKE